MARTESPRVARATDARPLVALVGNPNTGKTTLFNVLTGARARVGNYPGVTVERRVGRATLPERGRHAAATIDLLDLPGCYSLAARSRDEEIALLAVLGQAGEPPPDLVVAVVDAGQLARNLYLALELAELEVPLVVALNMADEIREPPDARAVSALLGGARCVPTVARRGEGSGELLAAIADRLGETVSLSPGATGARRSAVEVAYPEALRRDVDELVPLVPGAGPRPDRDRAYALWALGSVDADDALAHVPPALRARCLALQARAAEQGRDLDAEIIVSRYRFLDAGLASRPEPSAAERNDEAEAAARDPRRLSDRIDRVALHPVFGFAIFVALMLVVFQSLFTWADPAMRLIESAFGWLAVAAARHLPSGLLTDLATEGILQGVGNVVVFLPQILLLFLLLGLLEDSGYMARAAYLMDRVMRALGLHGRAFVPMLSGCACAIPAIMATRTMERERDRLLTMLVIPLMTCSARLPVYTLVIAALLPPATLVGLPVQGLMMMFMYLFSTAVTLGAAGVIGRTLVRGRRVPLLLELPPYRLPTLRSVLRQMLERAGVFLKEAGTVILACTVALWVVLSHPAPDSPRPHVEPAPPSAIDADPGASRDAQAALARWKAERIENSLGGRLGRALEPALAPLGFDWKIGVGILGAFAAREIFVSTMGLVYGIGEAADPSVPLREKIREERTPDGRPRYTPLVGLSLLVFFALACQCMSTLAVVRRETRSWRWPAFLFGYMTALAYLASLLVYQGGRLLGLG
jgi:ferrous iron transport protein B